MLVCFIQDFYEYIRFLKLFFIKIWMSSNLYKVKKIISFSIFLNDIQVFESVKIENVMGWNLYLWHFIWINKMPQI